MFVEELLYGVKCFEMPSSSVNPSKQVRLLSEPILRNFGNDGKENLRVVLPKNRLRTGNQVGESKNRPQDLETIDGANIAKNTHHGMGAKCRLAKNPAPGGQNSQSPL